MSILLHNIAYPVTALGPGRRVVVWVSGCKLDCKGCISPSLRDSASGTSISCEALSEHILGIPMQFSGLTLSGGEPFDQAAALSRLVSRLKGRRRDWNVIAFSGYRFATLRKDADCNSLLQQIDILIDGPYIEGNSGAHSLTASANQTIHSLSARGEVMREEIVSAPLNQTNIGLGKTDGHMLIGVIDPIARSRQHETLETYKDA